MYAVNFRHCGKFTNVLWTLAYTMYIHSKAKILKIYHNALKITAAVQLTLIIDFTIYKVCRGNHQQMHWYRNTPCFQIVDICQSLHFLHWYPCSSPQDDQKQSETITEKLSIKIGFVPFKFIV